MSVGGDPQMQELSSQLEELEQHREALNGEIEALESQKQDVDEAIEAVENLETDMTVQVPIGGGAYVRAEIEDIDEVIVDIGGDYSAERDQDGAIASLEHKKETLDARIAEFREDIQQVENQSQQVEQQLEQLRAQQMQQLQGQMQQDE